MHFVSNEEKQENCLRLKTTIMSVKWLALQGCSFRGHDESPSSLNSGNFIELVDAFAKINIEVGKVVLSNTPKNTTYTSPDIQKEILSIIANRVGQGIRTKIGDAKFSILVDEARDEFSREQMAIILSSVKSLIDMYTATCKVLEYLSDRSPSTRSRSEIGGVYKTITTFEFVFILHLMHRILAIADVLCQSLQKKTQDILTAMKFVYTTKTIFQILRRDGWEEFLEEVKCFCSKNDIHVPDFDGSYMVGHSRGREYPTTEHHYHFDIFNAAIDFQMMELDTRFNETSIELLSLSTTLDSKNSFESLNMDNICKLAEKFYLEDFK
ncbi:uncharacterized protein LOC111397809 [Olea europaea var. sylvestris]|uniref:uncharacterized protein LOC111397809 n=1 Tax=Olea europaea var. sylvestris TaxID=158386 RepID=UPI000C1D6CEE|nr:uncharacterized protein LOC111397809 [Olea europaea var. sylvestris]